ncbi:hypothetical protein I316_06482 [Kwoniella heveanensis BCC8398]|uniref:TFIIB-type domain-containing protein n=1 Tax=Kwoniella heveanensis BCC8398 TaxID=1296120 RepID=A0A1B9GLE7_9TREE|nr:hypothetical protein I316_06482 [Kwoniella heveanensis BCC8398]
MSSHTKCKECRRQKGIDVELERDPGGNWGCPQCGVVDQTVTDHANSVSVSQVVGSIVDEDKVKQTKEGYDRAQEKFHDGIRDIFNLYLGIPSAKTAIIAAPGEGLRNGAKKWFERIRTFEQKLYARQTLVSNPNARRIKYLVAISIKLAAQESAIIILERRLEEAGIKSKRRDLPGFTKGDDRVLNPTLWDLFLRANSFAPDSFGHMDSYDYFRKLWRRYTHLVQFALNPTESVLLHVDTVMTRLRLIVELPHEERVNTLLSRPAISKGGERDWTPEDFSYFEGLDWDKVIPAAYQLFRMSEVVRLWGNQCTPMIAIALLLWAIQAVTGVVMPQYSSFQRELAAFYGKTPWGTAEKFRDLRNLLIAWSTSILDAGHSFPVLPLPSKNGIGDGIHGYNADSRRPIPEVDIAVCVAPTLIAIWPQVVRARLRGRVDVMAYEDELWLARKMIVVSAGIYHYNQEALQKQLQPQTHMSRRKGDASTPREPKSKTNKTKQRAPRISYKFKLAADAARKEIVEFEPLKRAQVKSPAELYRQQQERSRQLSVARSMSVPSSSSAAPSPGPSAIPPPQSSSNEFVPPPPEKTIEDLLASPDLSSDEDYGSNSDEEEVNAVPPPTRHTVAHANGQLQSSSQPFAFTIGPQGFNIDTQPQLQPQSQVAIRTLSEARPNADSSSDLSPSPALMARRLSVDSHAGGGSASEAEAAISQTQARIPTPQIFPTSSPTLSDSRLSTPLLSQVVTPTPSSTTASRSASAAPPKRAPRVALEDDHVGLLVREREEYIQFRLPQLYESGYVVPPACELEMWKWLRVQVKNGSMPRHVDDAYLRSIGISGDPRRMDLGEWVDSKKDVWSPVESLLRAGIRPQEIPPQHIPFSMIHLKLLLHHWNKTDLAPIGEAVQGAQFDKEIEILFNGDDADQGDIWSQMILNEKEAKSRKQGYIKSGAWNADGEKEVFVRGKQCASSGKARVVKSIARGGGLADSAAAEDGDDIGSADEEEEGTGVDGATEDDICDSDYIPSASAGQMTAGRTNPSRTVKKGISRIQQNIRQSITNSRKQMDGLEGIIRVMQSGNENDMSAAGGSVDTADPLQTRSIARTINPNFEDGREAEVDVDVDLDIDGVDWCEGMIGALNFREMGIVDEVGEIDVDDVADENENPNRGGRSSGTGGARATKTSTRKRKNAMSGPAQTSPKKPAKRSKNGQAQSRGGASTFTGIASTSPTKSRTNTDGGQDVSSVQKDSGAATESGASWAMLPPSLTNG